MLRKQKSMIFLIRAYRDIGQTKSNHLRIARTADQVVTNLNLVMGEFEECSECRRYLGYLNNVNTKVYC